MVKAKDFWNILCNDFDYRFFSGVAHSEFKLLYNCMDSTIMHYVPAVNEITALGIASGFFIAGHKSGILIDVKFVSDLLRMLKFNKDYGIPVLIITTDDYNFNLPKKIIKNKKDIGDLIYKIEQKSTPGLMILEELK